MVTKSTAALLIGTMLVLSACANTAFALDEGLRSEFSKGRRLLRERHGGIVHKEGNEKVNKAAKATAVVGAATTAAGAATAAYGYATGDPNAQAMGTAMMAGGAAAGAGGVMVARGSKCYWSVAGKETEVPCNYNHNDHHRDGRRLQKQRGIVKKEGGGSVNKAAKATAVVGAATTAAGAATAAYGYAAGDPNAQAAGTAMMGVGATAGAGGVMVAMGSKCYWTVAGKKTEVPCNNRREG